MATDNGQVVFLKNSENQLTLLDQNLQARAFFGEIPAKILSIGVIGQGASGSILLIGCVNNKQQFKFLGYTV